MSIKIEIAKLSGYCFGVKRALEITEKTLKRYSKKNKKVYSIGQIIHNAGVVDKLKKEGLLVVNDISEIEPDSIFIVRSHGMPLSVLKKLKEKNVKIINTTCPFVKNAQTKARMLSKNNYYVVVIGDESHPEVISIVDQIKNKEKLAVISSPADVDKKINKVQKIGVVMQTTQIKNNAKAIISELIDKAKKIVIENTICNTTEKRQNEVKNLAINSELIIVVGGKNSANTTHLANIAKNYNSSVYHIENYREINPDWFKGKTHIGITGGASTPKEDIEEVKNYILNIK